MKMVFFSTSNTMASAEQPCYTLLYSSNDDEQANELQLKQDLGELSFFFEVNSNFKILQKKAQRRKNRKL